jgi:ankyrin repeat protein
MQADPAPPQDPAAALAAAAAAGDCAALAALLPPGRTRPPQAALDRALLDAVCAADKPRLTAESHAELAAAVAALLAAGAAPGFGDNGEGITLLHLAAQGGNADIVRHLLAAGARIDARAVPWHSAMPHHLAAERAHVEALRVLLDAGAEVRRARAGRAGRGGRQPGHVSHLPA